MLENAILVGERVAGTSRVGTVGVQTVQRIRAEGLRLEIDFDRIDRGLCGLLALGCDCQNRLPDEMRLIREDVVGRCRLLRYLVRSQNRDDSRQRQGTAYELSGGGERAANRELRIFGPHIHSARAARLHPSSTECVHLGGKS